MSLCHPAPYTLGARLSDQGCRFSLYAPDRDAVTLLLWQRSHQPTRIHMQEYKLGYWTAYVPHVKAGDTYSYEVLINGQAWCIADPYAQAVVGPVQYQPPYTPNQSYSLARCQVVDHQFDWLEVSRPAHTMSETVIFETHVKGLTQLHPNVEEHARGRYLGLIAPDMLRFYQDNQINCIQLLPIATCLSEPHLLSQQKTNYWGYNPYLWMAPDPRYAHHDAVTELKTAIRELHRHDIEVILDVVFNHTAEGGDGGPILHFKALDHAMYLHDKHQLVNYTGCGNTLDMRHPAAITAVLDSLRLWVTHYQVDGFRFDLAATLGREGEQFNPHAAFFTALAQDPVLSQVKLIAEPWDIGPNGYQLGQFPSNWSECNDKIRDTTRSLWRGEKHILQDFATRLMGSRDRFSAAHWPDHLSVNYLTYHDGFTLEDVVSYAQRHNHANGENNRDGHGDNRSANYGIEGPTQDPAIIAVRERQKRNLIASVLFAFGVPHLLTADLLAHSQQGNNNAYCQDNPISWLNWDNLESSMPWANWLSTMIKRRQAVMPAFIDAFSGRKRHQNRIRWRHPDGNAIQPNDWPNLCAVVCHIEIGQHHRHAGAQLLYCFNVSDQPLSFSLPDDKSWQTVCFTEEADTATRTVTSSFTLAAKSLSILTNHA